MIDKSVKVVFDTNIWISFLIGRRLAYVRSLLSNRSLTIVVCKQLLDEIRLVTDREKLKKYFPKSSVKELLELLSIIAEVVEVEPKHSICRDSKDNFLLDLIEASKADYLVTGDKDLLEHNPFENALKRLKII
jgi:uncharacterized protein